MIIIPIGAQRVGGHDGAAVARAHRDDAYIYIYTHI